MFTFENYKAYNAYCEKYGDENGDKIIEEMHHTVAQNLSEDGAVKNQSKWLIFLQD